MSTLPVADFALAAPEAYLVAAVCVVLVVDLFLPARARQVTYVLSLFVLLATALIVLRSPVDQLGFRACTSATACRGCSR